MALSQSRAEPRTGDPKAIAPKSTVRSKKARNSIHNNIIFRIFFWWSIE
jgi:hypothetical protein